MSPIYRVLTYALPFLLVIIEWIVRGPADHSLLSVGGPAISSAAIALTLPILVPRLTPVTAVAPAIGRPLVLAFQTDRDRRAIALATLWLLWSLAGWAFILYLNDLKQPVVGVPTQLFGWDIKLLLGGFFYIVAVALAEYKEVPV
jgi:uncharacterized membrane protein